MLPKLPTRTRIGAFQVAKFLLLIVAAGFLALHALHLSADFPNHSPWMDWSKYTDEGWYGDAAARHFLRGHWYVPGDFNPAVALPIWPLLEAALFRITGVSLTAARSLTVAIFGFILVCSYTLLRRWQVPSHPTVRENLAPATAILLLAVSPFCYAFTRMAILEPLLILLTLLALLAASYATPPKRGSSSASLSIQILHAIPILTLGVLLPVMVLTKTTAIFLFPAVLWLLWARSGYSIRAFLRMALPAVTLALITWLAYFGFIVRPHFLGDYHYLFSANDYTGIAPSSALSTLGETIADAHWIGDLFYPLAILAAIIALVINPRHLRNPLIPSLLLWAACYAAFLAYHDNLQPRYYLVIAVPLILLVPLVFESIWNRACPISLLHRMAAGALIAALAVVIVTDARQTLRYARAPEYTFARAASDIRDIVVADHTHNPLILSISGSNLSLMTGLPSICDDFGTMDLPVRIRSYRPGWYVTWNQVDDDKMEALAPTYHLKRIAAFPVMDDPERNLLILYRLDPTAPAPLHPRRKPAIPRFIRTTFRRQPATLQLIH